MLVWNKWSAIKLFFYKTSPLFLVVDLIKYPVMYATSIQIFFISSRRRNRATFCSWQKKKEFCFDLDFPKRKQSLFSRGQIMSLIQVALP